MGIRFSRKARRTSLVACALALAAGCVESTYVWTLNPGGSGKVEIEARLQPPLNPFDDETDPFETAPELLARGVARNILKKSEGVAAWTDVSSGIADDGRVLFRGTAYFGDLTRVEIEGDPFPLSILKPSLTNKGDGRLIVDLQLGDVSKDVPGVEKLGRGTRGPPAPPTTEETEGVVKDKVAYQAAKPILTAFLSTMRTEMIIRVPGEVEKVTNFRARDDGTLALTFDGPKFLAILDQLVARDAAEWRNVVDALSNEEDPEGDLHWRFNELLFGERGPVRVVVKSDGTPVFDYTKELAGVTDVRREFLGSSQRDPDSDRRSASTDKRSPEGDRWSTSTGQRGHLRLSGGPLASARTDLGTGTGWTGVLGGGGFLDLYMQVEVSRVKYENSDGVRRELHRAAVGGGGRFGPVVLGGGLAFSFGPGDIWATGPRVTCGVGFFGRRAELYLAASGYAWIGERDDEFDFDLEGDVRLAAGIRF